MNPAVLIPGLQSTFAKGTRRRSLTSNGVSQNLPRKFHMMVLERSAAPPVVLVVEDDMLLRMRAVDMVKDAGFQSVEAVDAGEAVTILEGRSDIALLFTDIQMPGSMDGLALAHAVHERWPGICIILVSGAINPADIRVPACSRFFGKPLEGTRMIAEMQEMIGRGRYSPSLVPEKK